MRSLLSVLRDDSSVDRELTINPGVSGIPDLCQDANRNGLYVTFHQSGQSPELEEARGLTIYRVIQECLTNVLKHAGSVETTVAIEWGTAAATIAVDNAPGSEKLLQPDGQGKGLTGIRERARIHQGHASWGESTSFPNGWDVTVRVPYA